MVEHGYENEGDRFCNCGRRIHRFESERARMMFGIKEHCRSRVCDRCAEYAYRRFRRQVLTVLDGLPQDGKKQVSFLTLTFKKRELTTAYIRQCTKAVRKFVNIFYGKWYHRKNKKTGRYAKTKSRLDCGGVAVMEIGKSGNLHFHLLVYGYFHPIKEMSRVWLDLTGDSYRIDIQNVSHSTKRSPARAAGYVLKYIRKPPAFTRADQYLEYWLLLKGLRRIHTYGVFYGHEAFKNEKRPLVCPFCGEPLTYRGKAEAGEYVLDYGYIKAWLDDSEACARDPAADPKHRWDRLFIREWYHEKLEYQKTVNDAPPTDTEKVDRGGVLRCLEISLDRLVKLCLN